MRILVTAMFLIAVSGLAKAETVKQAVKPVTTEELVASIDQKVEKYMTAKDVKITDKDANFNVLVKKVVIDMERAGKTSKAFFKTSEDLEEAYLKKVAKVEETPLDKAMLKDDPMSYVEAMNKKLVPSIGLEAVRMAVLEHEVKPMMESFKRDLNKPDSLAKVLEMEKRKKK